MQTLATADHELLSRMLSAESFHILVDDTGVVRGRGATLVELHAGEEGISSAAALLDCLAPAGGPLSFARLKALAGELLLLEYRPLALRLKGQFFVAPTGRYGVFLGAPCGVGEFPGTAASDAAGKHRGAAQARHQRLVQRHADTQPELQRLQAAVAEKSRVLATVSHEIRSPLDGILSLSQRLLDTPLNDEQREYLNLARESGESLLHLVDDVLELSRMEAGCLPLVIGEFDPGEVLASVSRQFQLRAAEAGILLHQASQAGPAYVGDHRRIAQILINLLANALKFSRRGGRIWLDVIEDLGIHGAPQLHFTVRDEGVGMSAAAVARIFEPYTQADAGIAQRFGGTGLGLSICRDLVTLMGGLIWVSSVEGAGSAFHFTIRVAPVRASEVAGAGHAIEASLPESLPPAEAATSQPEVLLVEDNVVSQKVATAFLRMKGYRTRVARNGLEALRQLGANRSRFAAVLTDCQMPLMDGFELTRRLRQQEFEHPELGRLRIIALTANAMVGDRERCLAAGMDDYMAKPVDPDRLAAMLAPVALLR